MFFGRATWPACRWDAAGRGTGCQRHEDALLNWVAFSHRGLRGARPAGCPRLNAPSQHVCAARILPINDTEVRIENSWIQLGSWLLAILADCTFRADVDR